jgi:hypothetical protein
VLVDEYSTPYVVLYCTVPRYLGRYGVQVRSMSIGDGVLETDVGGTERAKDSFQALVTGVM